MRVKPHRLSWTGQRLLALLTTTSFLKKRRDGRTQTTFRAKPAWASPPEPGALGWGPTLNLEKRRPDQPPPNPDRVQHMFRKEFNVPKPALCYDLGRAECPAMPQARKGRRCSQPQPQPNPKLATGPTWTRLAGVHCNCDLGRPPTVPQPFTAWDDPKTDKDWE